jgi:nucleoside-diphosphate-sugar epimerase
MPEYKQYIDSGKLELPVTGDLVNGDYTEAIKGVTAVVHVASPVEFGDKEFRESHLAPALQGTRGVLEAAAKEPSVKAVVMTSTVGESSRGIPREMPLTGCRNCRELSKARLGTGRRHRH